MGHCKKIISLSYTMIQILICRIYANNSKKEFGTRKTNEITNIVTIWDFVKNKIIKQDISRTCY
ncbi:MAG: hypothetical protein ACRBB2_02550 [Nitrosopumilus sp.]